MSYFFIAFTCCAVSILALRKIAYGVGFVDCPKGHKQHAHPTPAVGGMAMFLAVFLALSEGGFNLDDRVGILLICAAILLLLGMYDDRHDLPILFRMIVQIVLSLVVVVEAGGEVSHLGALYGSDIALGMWAIPFSVIAYVGGINSINMIDGVDGVAGKMIAITLLGVATIFYHSGVHELLPLLCSMLGALTGFLMFNTRIFVKRAWIFMGDAGTMWLGLVIGWLMAQIIHTPASAEPALVFWLFGVPLIDTLAVIFRRIQQKRSPFSADRTHIHHMLGDAGFSVKRTVLILSVLQLVSVSVGVYLYLVHASSVVIFWGFVCLLVGYCYFLHHRWVGVVKFCQRLAGGHRSDSVS